MSAKWMQKLFGKTRPEQDSRFLQSEEALLKELDQRLGARTFSGRGAVARAAGYCRSGRRATLNLGTGELLAETASLGSLAESGLPLVLNLVSGLEENSGAQSMGEDLSSCLKLLRQAGWLVLQPTSPDELLALAVLARKLSEDTLCPVALMRDFSIDGKGLFPMKSPGKSLPEWPVLLDWIGAPDDTIETPLPWQQALHGRKRLRLPEHLDLAQPRANRVRPSSEQARHRSQAKILQHKGLRELLTLAMDDLAKLCQLDFGPAKENSASNTIVLAHGRVVQWLEQLLPAQQNQELANSTVLGIRLLSPLMSIPATGAAKILMVSEQHDDLVNARQTSIDKTRHIQIPARAEGLTTGDFLQAMAGVDKTTQPGLRIQRQGALTPRDELRSQELEGLFAPTASGTHDQKFWKKGLGAPAAIVLMAADSKLCETTAARLCRLLDDYSGAQMSARRIHPGHRDRGLTAWRVEIVRESDRPFAPGDTSSDMMCLLDPRSARELPKGLLDLAEVLLQILSPERIPLGRVPEQAVSSATVDHGGECFLGVAPTDSGDELCGAIVACLLKVRQADLNVSLQQAMRDNSAFKKGFSSLRRLTPELLPARTPQTLADSAHKNMMMRLNPSDAALDDPHRMAAFSTLNEPGDGVCDPLSLSGLLPARSGRLRRETRRPDLPWLDASLCTSCGDCWTVCPEGALPLKRLAAGELLEALFASARDSGKKAIQLEAKQRQLAQGLEKRLKKAAGEEDGSALLYAELEQQLKNSDDEGLRAEVRHMQNLIADLPLVRFPDVARTLLALGVDADACKGCSLCAQSCQPGALVMQNWEESREHAGLRWNHWQQLPQTVGTALPTAEECHENPDRSMCDTEAADAFGPGDDSPAGNTARAAIRLFAGMVSARGRQGQPLLSDALAEHQQKLLAVLQEQLSGGADDTARLREVLKSLGDTELESSELTQKLHPEGLMLNREHLGLLAEVIEDLKTWQQELELSPASIVMGLALPEHRVEVRWPWNPAAVPLLQLNAADGADELLGLLEARLDQWTEKIRLLRMAKLLVTGRYRPEVHDAWFAAFNWSQLSSEEWQNCPAMVLGLDSAAFQNGRLGAWQQLLKSPAPLKILVICDAGDPDALDLSALAGSNIFAFSGSHGDLDHLRRGLYAALSHNGPALCTVYCSRLALGAADQSGTAAGLRMAQLAFKAGIWPHYVYDPCLSEELAGRLVLHPEQDSDGGTGLEFPEGYGCDGPLSLAHFRAMEGCWSNNFPVLDPAHPQGGLEKVTLGDYLEQDAEERVESLPVIQVTSPGTRSLDRIPVESEVKACETLALRWKQLHAARRDDIIWPDEGALRKAGEDAREAELHARLSASLLEMSAPLSDAEREDLFKGLLGKEEQA